MKAKKRPSGEKQEWRDRLAEEEVKSTLCVSPVVPWCRACGEPWGPEICCGVRRELYQLTSFSLFINSSSEDAAGYAELIAREEQRRKDQSED